MTIKGIICYLLPAIAITVSAPAQSMLPMNTLLSQGDVNIIASPYTKIDRAQQPSLLGGTGVTIMVRTANQKTEGFSIVIKYKAFNGQTATATQVGSRMLYGGGWSTFIFALGSVDLSGVTVTELVPSESTTFGD